jgi:pSer/pThr/pTyr-binding forkhead associated (FHA) protein
MPKLHVLSGVLEGKVFELTEERITVGRGQDNMIRLDDGTISHHHALLVLENGDYKVRDLNSTNGTRVNGLRVVETRIHDGDQVRMGSVEMRYESLTKKSSQPLPPVQTGIDLTQLGSGSTPPPQFAPASPFAKKKKSTFGVAQWIIIALGVIALAVVVFVIYKLTSVAAP